MPYQHMYDEETRLYVGSVERLIISTRASTLSDAGRVPRMSCVYRVKLNVRIHRRLTFHS